MNTGSIDSEDYYVQMKEQVLELVREAVQNKPSYQGYFEDIDGDEFTVQMEYQTESNGSFLITLTITDFELQFGLSPQLYYGSEWWNHSQVYKFLNDANFYIEDSCKMVIGDCFWEKDSMKYILVNHAPLDVRSLLDRSYSRAYRSQAIGEIREAVRTMISAAMDGLDKIITKIKESGNI